MMTMVSENDYDSSDGVLKPVIEIHALHGKSVNTAFLILQDLCLQGIIFKAAYSHPHRQLCEKYT